VQMADSVRSERSCLSRPRHFRCVFDDKRVPAGTLPVSGILHAYNGHIR
jgi:hypothetical protein